MVDYDVFPDVEALVGAGVRTANLAGLGARVYSSIPNSPTWPLVIIKRIAGIPVERHRLDQARVQVEVWGQNKGEAEALAQQVRVEIHRLEGTAPNGAVIAGVDDDLGLSWQPDPVTSRDRYIFGVAITLHAA